MQRSSVLIAAAILSLGVVGYAPAAESHDSHAQHAAAPATPAKAVKQAVAEIKPTTGNKAEGTVRFTQQGNKVKVVANITGLAPNSKHGFHIHEGTECGDDGMKAGGHYNPEGHQHAGPDAQQRHAGDFGNLQANKKGAAHLELTVDNISLGGEKNNVLGRAVIVHAQPDDLKSQPTGNAGTRIGCGLIKAVEKKSEKKNQK